MKKITTGIGPILGLVVLLLVSLKLMSDATENSTRFGELYSVLLLINALGLVTLGGLVGWNLFRLIGQVRARRAGAGLTVRMVAMFVILSVTPVLVVYYFSLQFLHSGIDSWFDVRIERALDDALELSRTALESRMRELLKQTQLVATDLSMVVPDKLPGALEDARRLSGAAELSIIGPNGRIIASSNIDPTAIVPASPDDSIIVQLRQSGNYIGLDPIGDTGLHVRVVVTLPEDVPSQETRILQALFPVTERMSSLADSVQSAYAKYRELAYLRNPLKVSFTLTLSLVLLLSLLAAVWAAFYSARRMVAPLRDLVQGTRAVAEGDYETQLPRSGKNEVGFLVESFNQMTRRLRNARDETRRSQVQLEEQRAYLEAVLSRLSTGVITLDLDRRFVTVNHAAQQILGVNLQSHLGYELESVAESHIHLRPFTESVALHLQDAASDDNLAEWREQLILFGASGRQVLMCSGAPLPVVDGRNHGNVLVFDDITTLMEAQRSAAWSEVARRLAHEIKNPLTPIQLSAERLRHKYLRKLTGKDADGLDRLTRTIVQQVEAMKEMVNTFSDYARMPRMVPERCDVNELISDVIELYRGDKAAQHVELHLSELPQVHADPGRLRQILHNLIKNAIEANEGVASPSVAIETRCVRETARSYIEIRVRDSGPGFQKDVLQRVFEPYVTTKPKGNGLGLAIVKRIVEEHGGVVSAENHEDGGASVVIQLPIATRIADIGDTPASRREAV
ncbi:MAG: ATP-binding protein [Gammaproteobacteria bacterium]|nr:ATP-binding protein [Gammaproteobacteria bacterium]MDH3412354.1 ATP-binding protein [Gammaproteobacteria bacterium]